MRSAVVRMSYTSEDLPNLLAALDTRDVNRFAQELSKIR